MEESPLIIGCDIGGTKTAVVLGTPDGRIVWRHQFLTETGGGFSAAFGRLSEGIVQAQARAGKHAAALSVSIGGPLDIMKGIIKSPPNLPGWDDIPLKQMLMDQFGLPVHIEHDGNAGALAEMLFGAGRGCKNLVFLTMGTGLGAGIILDGRLYRGTNDVAGEVGHIRIAEKGPDCYGKAGSFEGYCSGTGITRLAEMLYPGKWQGGVQELYEAWKHGDTAAGVVFGRSAEAFGRGLAMIVDMLNPERIILGGLGIRIADALVEPALRLLRTEALPQALEVCSVVPAQLGESIGDYAALCAALDQGGLRQSPPVDH